jgi:hypothetical protein
MWRKLNGPHQLLLYADDVNLLGDNIDTIKKTGILVDARKEAGLEVNADRTKYMFVSGHQNVGQNRDRSFENLAQFENLGTVITNQNLI